jgi:uncharacterized protein YjdB
VTLSQKTLTGDAGTSKDITVTVTPEGAPQDVAITPANAKIATAVKKNGNTYTVSLVAAGSANIDFVADKVKSTLAVTVSTPK